MLDAAPRAASTGRPVLDKDLLARLILVDSAIDEALRLTTGSLTIGVARSDVDLASGPLRIRQGE